MGRSEGGRLFIIFVLQYLLCFFTAEAEFNPNVTVTSCTTSEVAIHLDGAIEGGLIYIQERGSACKQTTYENPYTYTFNFALCNIEYDESFRVIVQASPQYQTGLDKAIPIICMVDTSQLLVNGFINPQDVLDSGQNKTTKPTATMRIFVHSSDITGGSVQLDETLTMNIILDQEFAEDFDIKASDCTASVIELIREGCAENEELFPNFDRPNKGELLTNFNAFQPTDLSGSDDVEVPFTCTLSVCKGQCEKTVCEQTLGWGRKKRNAPSEENEVAKIMVGTTLRVVSPKITQKKPVEDPNFCVNKLLGVLAASGIGVILIVSWTCSGYLSCRLRQQSGKTRMDGLQVARAVGRRVSAALNLPISYKLGEKKHSLNDVPEEDHEDFSQEPQIQITRMKYHER